MNTEIANALRKQAERTLDRENRLRSTPFERAYARGILFALNSLQEGGHSENARGSVTTLH